MAEHRLNVLLAEMNPELHEGAWAFCVTDVAQTDAIATFMEREGTTVVLAAERASALGLEPFFLADWITLTVNSSLDAVGFLAVISARLAEAGISCNVFSAVHHDHLFVPRGRGHDAIAALKATM
jgi:hypothetical protein